MKTVFGEVMEGEVKTETGTEIDAILAIVVFKHVLLNRRLLLEQQPPY